MQVGAYAFDGDGQITLRAANQKHVIHIEQQVRYEPPSGYLAGLAVHALLGEMLFAEVVSVAQVVVREPLAQITAYVESVIALVLVDEMKRQIQ